MNKLTPAAKLELIMQLLGGQPIRDENGHETGELTPAIITKEQALKLLQTTISSDSAAGGSK